MQTPTEKNRNWLGRMVKEVKETGKFFTETVRIDPCLANVILENNPDNRNMREAAVTKYARDMKEGRWANNGEPIIIAKTGELNDGQHRLKAIVNSGVAIHALVVIGPERSTRQTVDVGAARTAGDHLSLSGQQNALTAAAIARLTLAWEYSEKETLGRPSDISSSAIIQRVNSDPLIREIAAWADSYGPRMKMYATKSVLGFCYNAFASVHPAKAKMFMESMRDGIGLDAKSSIRLAREKLNMAQRTSRNQKIEVLFRAWNNWVKDREVSGIPIMGNLPKLEGK